MVPAERNLEYSTSIQSKMRVTTFKSWFRKNAISPLLIAFALVFLMVSTFLAYAEYTHLKKQDRFIERISSIATIAYNQNNRALIESALSLTTNELNAKVALICSNNQVLISIPSFISSCNPTNTNFLFRSVVTPLSGNSLTHILLLVPILPDFFSWILILSSSVLFLLLITVSLYRVYGAIKKDILFPFQGNLVGNTPFHMEELNQIRSQLNATEKLRTENAVASAIFSLSAQVAHDIRSPLAALSILETELELAPIETKNLFRSSLKRITKIADDLLAKRNILHSENYFFDNKTISTITTECLKSEINSIVSEKVYQHKNSKKIVITHESLNKSESNQVYCDQTEIGRVISNLLNNSIEAMPNGGEIKIISEVKDSIFLLSVTDSGIGIPKHLIETLGSFGITRGKDQGNGLGLYHAKKTIERYGGTILIESTIGAGTTVTIHLKMHKQAVNSSC